MSETHRVCEQELPPDFPADWDKPAQPSTEQLETIRAIAVEVVEWVKRHNAAPTRVTSGAILSRVNRLQIAMRVSRVDRAVGYIVPNGCTEGLQELRDVLAETYDHWKLSEQREENGWSLKAKGPMGKLPARIANQWSNSVESWPHPDLPKSQLTEPLTKGQIAKFFSVGRNRADEVLEKYWHDEICGKYRLCVADMPPKYTAKQKA
jgi:hypothetical protein